MKSRIVWLIVLLAVAGAAAGGYWLGHRGAGKAAADPDDAAAPTTKEADKPVASVTVTPVRSATVSDQIVAYGTVTAPASEVRAVSVPFEARVTKVMVMPGQTVAADQPLVEVEGSAATSLALQEAQNAASAADRDLRLVQQRFDQKLATNTDLNTSQNAQKLAQGRLQALEQGGAGGPRQLKADAPGVVSKIDVQIGQIVPIGSPLIEVAAQNHIEVHLGAEPRDAPNLKTGQPVSLRRVDDPGTDEVVGKIRLVGQRVDPVTRLVDVVVSLPPDAKLLLEGFVTARVPRASAEGLVVPRDAVLPAEDNTYELFTVKDGRAVRHVVRVGVENDRETQVIADDLKAGDMAVVVGNLELEDGVSVQAQLAPATEAAGTQPAETRPANGPTEERS